jgi:hypothetical protein
MPLDARVRAFMREHDEPDYTVALERVMQLDEMDEPAPQPAALPDAESVFDSLPRTGALEEGHRRLFVERYPPTDKYVDELTDSAPKGDQAGGG